MRFGNHTEVSVRRLGSPKIKVWHRRLEGIDCQSPSCIAWYQNRWYKRLVLQRVKSDRPIVFVSYARKDREFVLRLAEALELKGAQVCGDWQLVRGEDYDTQLQDLQLDADAMIFVLSPDSV